MSRKNNFLRIFVLLLTTIPCLLVSFRIQIINFYAKKIGVVQIQSEKKIELNCNEKFCQKKYYFSINSLNDKHLNSIGFYNVFLSGLLELKSNEQSFKIDEILRSPPNWHRFQQHELSDLGDFYISALAPVGRKKIGMESDSVFWGDQDSIASIGIIHSLFNVHIYLALSVFSFVVFGIIRIGHIKKKIYENSLYGIVTCILIAFSYLFFSHVFDSVFFHIGFSLGLIENAAKLVWGLSIFFLLFPRKKEAPIFSFLYFLIFVFLGGCNDVTPKVFYQVYPVLVLIIGVICFINLFFVGKNQKLLMSIVTGAIIFDGLAINGFVPLFSSSYLSPLTFLGWFFGNYINEIQTVVNVALFGQRQEVLIQKIIEIRKLKNTSDVSQEKFLSLISSLAFAVKADRSSLLILDHGIPIIFRYNCGTSSIIEDGFTPPVFARIIQTREEMFLVDGSFLTPIKNRDNRDNRDSFGDLYIKNYAIIMPIFANQKIVGAISLTDFKEEDSLLFDSHHQEHIRNMISLVITEVEAMAISDNQAHLKLLEKVQEEISSQFIMSSYLEKEPLNVFTHFGKSLFEKTGLSSIYFNYNPDDECAKYSNSYGLSDLAIRYWSQENFYSRKENKLSPIAIAVNEKRSIYIDDIRTFFSFLKEKSISALRASSAKGFAVIPVKRFGKVDGVIFILQSDSDLNYIQMSDYSFLDKCADLFALQIYQSEISAKSFMQENVLKKIIEPTLLETLLKRRDLGEKVVGVVEDSFMFLVDLRGSTVASRKFQDPIELAKKLSKIYEKADAFVRLFGGYFEKGNGDGLLFTLRNEIGVRKKILELLLNLDSVLSDVAEQELGIKKIIMVAHHGKLFRGLMGGSERIAWDNCGADLINCFDIEKSAKKIENIVLAISDCFLLHFSTSFQNLVTSKSIKTIVNEDTCEKIFLFDEKSKNDLFDMLSDLDLKSA